MSKFKVGDKVRVTRDGTIGVISRADDWRIFPYMLKDDPKQEPFEESELERVEPIREFILIHCDGGEVVTDRTPPVDGSSFDERAKLAFDRLMWREEPKLIAMGDTHYGTPQPAPKFKVGDRVVTQAHGAGTVSDVAEGRYRLYAWYRVELDSGGVWDDCEANLSPAPEPKYYTGKVFCAGCETGSECAYKDLIGRVLRVDNGKAEWLSFDSGYVSFEDMKNRNACGRWHEVKE